MMTNDTSWTSLTHELEGDETFAINDSMMRKTQSMPIKGALARLTIQAYIVRHHMTASQAVENHGCSIHRTPFGVYYDNSPKVYRKASLNQDVRGNIMTIVALLCPVPHGLIFGTQAIIKLYSQVVVAGAWMLYAVQLMADFVQNC
ncbi:hypothetical protein Ancab_014825 [Ancistrocladus abbreviatus]